MRNLISERQKRCKNKIFWHSETSVSEMSVFLNSEKCHKITITFINISIKQIQKNTTHKKQKTFQSI